MRPDETIYCKRCGKADIPDVGPGTNVHAGRLICATCGLFLTWIRKIDAHYFDIPEQAETEEKHTKQMRLF